jgi:hypothetical protein
MEQFIQLSLTNLKEVQSPTPNNHKIQLAVASQMLGSGKTWFGRYLLDSARRNREKLLKKFDQKDLDYFLSAHYVGIDLRELEGKFSNETLENLFLERLIVQCPESKFEKAKQFWNDKDIHGRGLRKLAKWFVQFLEVPLFFHFDEVDAINNPLVSHSLFISIISDNHTYRVLPKILNLIKRKFRIITIFGLLSTLCISVGSFTYLEDLLICSIWESSFIIQCSPHQATLCTSFLIDC